MMMTGCLWKMWWLLPSVVIANPQMKRSENKTSLVTNSSKSRSLEDRQDMFNYQSSYYPYPTYGPPPSYGPPPELPTGTVVIEFAFDEIVLRCIAEEPFEHIVWIRYKCPQQFLFGSEGDHVADGSTVYDDDLYDVHIRGHDGTIISELLIKEPLDDSSEGIYQCEVWPHVHGGGGYTPYGPYHNYYPPKSDVFIIGGNSLLEDCYQVNAFGHQTNKMPTGINKVDSNGNKDTKLMQNLSAIKPRRNGSEARKNSSSKQLHYSLKYVDNTLYNVDGENVTSDFFRPMKISLESFNPNILQSSDKLNKNKSNPNFSFDGRERPNNKFKKIFP